MLLVARAAPADAQSASAPGRTGASAASDGAWEQLNAEFNATQRALLEERARLPEELRRLARTRSVVPPLPPGSAPDEEGRFVTLSPVPVSRIVQALTPERYRAGTYQNLLLPAIEIDPTRARLEVSVKASAAAAKGPAALVVEGKRTVLAVSADAAPVFMDPNVTLETAARLKLEGPAVIEFRKTLMENDTVVDHREMKVGYKFRVAEAAIGFSSKDGLVVEAGKEVSVKGGRRGEYAAAVEARGTVPARMKEPWLGLAVVSAQWGRTIARWISAEVVCPYCRGLKRAHCPTCQDKLKVTCPKCLGAGGPECSRCKGRGKVPCDRQVSCGSCSGTGRNRCSTCSGSGSVGVWDTVSGTRRELVIDSIGFDSAGQPVYNRHYEDRPYTEQRYRRESCDACGGSGRQGSCGRCAGSGRVTCPRCKGTGWKGCWVCGGDGRTRCWTCGGRRSVSCGECSGRVHSCGPCGATGKIKPQ